MGFSAAFLALLLDGCPLDLVGAEAALAHERLRRFVIDRCERRKLAEQLLEEG